MQWSVKKVFSKNTIPSFYLNETVTFFVEQIEKKSAKCKNKNLKLKLKLKK